MLNILKCSGKLILCLPLILLQILLITIQRIFTRFFVDDKDKESIYKNRVKKINFIKRF